MPQIDGQIARIDDQMRQAAGLLGNASTRQQGMAMLNQLQSRRQHFEDQKLQLSDPTAVMRQRAMELEIAAKEKSLSAPDLSTPEGRSAYAERFGLAKDSPSYKHYVLTGKMPRDDQKEMTASDRNAVRKAEDEILKAKNAQARLGRALDLNNDTNSGMLASTRASIGNIMPDVLVPDFISSPKSSEATREYSDIMSQEAIKQMGDDLTGASTDFEMKKYMEIVGDVSKPAAIRQRALERMIEAGNKFIALQQDRARDIRGGDYYGKTYEAPSLKSGPAPGTVKDGYRFKGGDPGKPESWERVQ
jgi:hypothetical protein